MLGNFADGFSGLISVQTYCKVYQHTIKKSPPVVEGGGGVKSKESCSYKLRNAKINTDRRHFYNLGLDMRKPVFEDWQTTNAQTSLRIRADWSAPLLFILCKVLYLNLLRAKFQFSSLSLQLSRLVWISLSRKS